jgi:hypothetical protein
VIICVHGRLSLAVCSAGAICFWAVSGETGPRFLFSSKPSLPSIQLTSSPADAMTAARAGVVAGDGSHVMIRTERFDNGGDAVAIARWVVWFFILFTIVLRIILTAFQQGVVQSLWSCCRG